MGAPDFSLVVDVVDTQNRPIGQSARRELFSNKQNFRTVHVFITNKEQTHLLLQSLAGHHIRNPHKLGSSAAGYLRSGETYKQAAKRKVREELGINSRSIRLSEVAEFAMDDSGVIKFVGLFSGYYNAMPQLRDSEAKSISYYAFSDVDRMLQSDPAVFTETFIYAYREFRERGYPIARDGR
jgi:isopentenyl-diphosphate delta-isomerase